jgi:regulatory protein
MNEERFAISFAGGKFRIKNWGRIKIKLALKQKKVSEYCIRKALSGINDKDYQKTLEKIISAYAKKVNEKNPLKKNYKIAQHVIGKGFEPELVWEVLRIEN